MKAQWILGMVLLGSLGSLAAVADIEIIQDGVRYSCTPTGGSEGLCALASLEKNGYVSSDCKRVTNRAQDECAAATIRKLGYVASDCLTLNEGGRCALASLEINGYIASDCKRVESYAQDVCAEASLRRNGYVSSDCFGL